MISVLLVDDEVELTGILARVLRRRGLEVEVAGDGTAALAALAARTFDVVLLDVRMPGMDGLQVLAEITGRGSDTRVILMTGHLRAGEEESCLARGAFAYLLKPHPVPALLALIEAAASAGRSGQP